jgi:kynurenine formamidase
MSVTDLSHLVTNGMPVYPGTPPAILKPFASVKEDGFNELNLSLTTHTGTHIDCPLHIIEHGFTTMADINLFYGSGMVVNCSEAGEEIPLSLFFQKSLLISKTDFILLFTGWDRNWGSQEYFENFPVLSQEAAEYLSELNIKGIGVDAPSFDPFGSEDLPIHHKFLSRGKILIENLTHLGAIPQANFDFSCLPLHIQNGDGSPVRAAAIIK